MATNSLKNPRGILERPRDSGIYWISYVDADGKRHREKVGRKSVAIKAYFKRKQEIREGKFIPPMDRRPSITLRELAGLTIAAKRGRHSQLSVRSDEWRAAKLLDEFGSQRCSAIEPERLEQWLSQLHNSGLSGPTVNRYRSLMSSIFSYGVRMGKISANPVARVARYEENPGRVRFLSSKEESLLRSTIRKLCPEHEPEFDLALYTGMRRGEQFSLKWEQVDFDNGIVTAIGKTGRRFIPLNLRAHKALLKLRRKSESPYVGAETRHEGQRDWRRWFEEAVKVAKISNFTWHDLRHTFASRLVMAGKDLRSVQELLGHRSILTTMKYAHLSPAHLRDAVDSLCIGSRSRRGASRAMRRKRTKGNGTGSGTGLPKRRGDRGQVL